MLEAPVDALRLVSIGWCILLDIAACYMALGIYFISTKHSTMNSFLHSSLSHHFLSMSDANWRPQDASMSWSTMELALFVSCSMSAIFVHCIGCPKAKWLQQSVLWRQKYMQWMNPSSFFDSSSNSLIFLEVKDIYTFYIIYNDNQAHVDWSKASTPKGLCPLQMKENHVWENIQIKLYYHSPCQW